MDPASSGPSALCLALQSLVWHMFWVLKHQSEDVALKLQEAPDHAALACYQPMLNS